jgi:hypothetical protein
VIAGECCLMGLKIPDLDYKVIYIYSVSLNQVERMEKTRKGFMLSTH